MTNHPALREPYSHFTAYELLARMSSHLCRTFCPRVGMTGRFRLLTDSIRRHLCNRAGVNIGGNDTARVIGQLEAAQDLHQIVDLASGGGPAWFKVLLHTQTSKESQDDTG